MLLILSEDDTTFTPACREDLIALMPSPTVVTDLTGGHLALMVRLEQYADLVTNLFWSGHHEESRLVNASRLSIICPSQYPTIRR